MEKLSKPTQCWPSLNILNGISQSIVIKERQKAKKKRKK